MSSWSSMAVHRRLYKVRAQLAITEAKTLNLKIRFEKNDQDLEMQAEKYKYNEKKIHTILAGEE